MSKHDEIIGYIPRTRLQELGALPESTTGMKTDLSTQLLEELAKSLQWGVRGPLEEDPTCKQLIPYIVLQRGDDHVFTMRRKRTQREARLHDKLSIGVGGHMNPISPEPTSPLETIRINALRELEEEVSLEGSTWDELTWERLGLLNDDSNDVGQVHLGLVYLITIPEHCTVEIREVDKLEGFWSALNALEEEHLETWSHIVRQEINAA